MQVAAATQPRGRTSRYLAPAALATLLAAVIVVVVTSVGSSGTRSSSASSSRASVSGLRPYWTVRPGQTYTTQISEKTGLTIDQLEAFNPYTDPHRLVPGSA